MGRVYLARDPNIERRIALKVLMPERLAGADEEEIQQRFLQEAKAAGGLSHHGIVTIYDADTDPDSGCPYLAMEWVRGTPLRTLLRREGPLAPERAVSMAAQVARALDYAHRREVVHRDVKPGNLLVTGDDTVKVVDFGIAKLVSNSLTRPGRVVGSPCYMAPEQLRGQAVDGRSDLFSLGAVLYQCLTGRVAFRGENVANVQHKILTADPRPIELYNPGVPASLRAVVARALEKLPQERYRSGAELAAALETVGTELTLGHRPVPAPATPSGTATEAMSGRTQVDSATGEPPPATGSRRRWPLAALAAVLLVAGVLVGRSLGPQVFGFAKPGADSAAELKEAAAPPLLALTEPEAPATAVETETATPEDDAPGRDRPPKSSPPASDASGSAAGEARPEPAVETPPVAAVTTDLEIVHESRIKLAYLSIWIDGRRALSVKLETKNPFKRIKGRKHRWLLPVPAGRRSVEVHLSGVSKPLELRRKAWRVFSAEDPQRLTLKLPPGSEQLEFLWADR